VTEAALYAAQYKRQQQLVDYYAKDHSAIAARLPVMVSRSHPDQPRRFSWRR